MAEVKTKKLFHCTYALSYHFVFVSKYRKKCFSGEMLESMEKTFARLLEGYGRLAEFNGEEDHVHLLVEMNPKASPSGMANMLKTVSSRLLRKEFEKELKMVYGKPVLWSRSYFVSSCGGATLDVIKQYIEKQARPH